MISCLSRRCRYGRLRRLLLWIPLSMAAFVLLRYIFLPANLYVQLRSGIWKRPSNPACVFPLLDLNNSVINSFFHPVKNAECNSEPDWICVSNGRASLCDHVKYPDVRCNYSFVQRQDDHKNTLKHIYSTNGSVELSSDFFHVRCEANDSQKTTWVNLMAGIKKDNTPRITLDQLASSALKLNVLMFGYDSLSRLTFIRKLPLTYRYLIEELGAVVLQGYNIVGDGTPQALIPILTGQTELELPETRKRMGESAHFVNVYPFVWNEFKQHGYVTSFDEDSPSVGTFTYRLKGFGDQPTDHYMRPFYLAVDNVRSQHQPYCLGSQPRHKVMMDYIEDFFDSYKNNPKFFFGFQGDLSHDDFNLIGMADNDTLNMLKHLKERGHLNHTMLIVMSDHGHRFASIRETQQGKLEERLPFFSFSLPEWFKTKYPRAWNNLLTNSKRLTSPFDIHPTLQSVLDYNEMGYEPAKKRSISLFHEISENRTCSDADIENHWCSCLSWKSEDVDSPTVLLAAQALVSHINNLTLSHRSLCDDISLQSIERAEKYVPRDKLLKYKKNADTDGFVGDFSDSTAISEVLYQIKIVTTPGEGHFEASVAFHTSTSKFDVRTDAISRINAYHKDALCIMDIHQDLRKYCYCKKDS